MTLEQFTQELKKDEMWLEAMRNPSRGKSMPDAIAKVYGQAVSDGSLLIKAIGEHRKHVFNVLGTMPFGKTTGVQLQQEPIFKGISDGVTEQERESVDYETQQKRLSDWLKSIEQAPEPKRITRKVPGLTLAEIQEEGQERPKRPVYMRDDAYVHEHRKRIHQERVNTVRDRHPELDDEEIEQYIKENFGNAL